MYDSIFITCDYTFFKFYCLYFLLSILFLGYSLRLTADAKVFLHGDLIRSEQITIYNKEKLVNIVNEELIEFLNGSPMPFDNFKGRFAEPTNSLTLYKLTYQTCIPEKNNKPTIATGLIAIPTLTKSTMPLISYQHGTVFGKMDVPSHIDQSMETKLMLAQFGGQGYIVIAPDYIGLGDSKELNSYFVMKSTEKACMDMYSAAKQFLSKNQIGISSLFTVGWSQGGYNNMVFLRALESNNITVTASASASAPVDMAFFISRGICNPRPNDAFYTPASLSNIFMSFENYYGLKGLTKSAIRTKYVNMSDSLYRFKMAFMDYYNHSTGNVVDFLKPEFIEQIRMNNTPFSKLLNQLEAYRWLSKTPLRAYSGAKDEVVPEYLARLAVDYQSLLGKKNGASFSAGENADHRATYIYALIDLKPWFDGFLK